MILDDAGQEARWSGADFREKESVLAIGNHFTGDCFSPDGRFLAVGSANGNLSVWDLFRRVLRREFKLGDGGVYPKSFLAQGNRLVVLLAAGQRFSEWDLEANREIQSWPASGFTHLGFDVSTDERLVVTVGFNGDFSGRNLSEHSNTNLPLDVLEGGVLLSHLTGHTSRFLALWDMCGSGTPLPGGKR